MPGGSRVDETGALVLRPTPGGWCCRPARCIFAGRWRCCSPLTSATPTRSSRVHDGERVVGEWRCRTERQRTADEYFVWLQQLMEHRRHRRRRIDSVVVSSVVPQVAVQPAGARRPLFQHPRQGGRRARRQAAGSRPRVDPAAAGRRRPAGQHRRRARPLRRRPHRRRLRHRHHLRRRRRRRRLRRRRHRAGGQPVAEGAARRGGGAALHRRDQARASSSGPTPSPACSRGSTGATSA